MSKKNPLLSNYVAITSNGSVELAENKDTKFKRFWKQIAGYGEFVDPRGTDKKMTLDKAWGDRIVDNFKNGPIKRVSTPLGHPKTSAELAERNKGWLIEAEARDDGLYGLLEVRDSGTAENIENGTLADTSVAFDELYTDKKTGKVFRDVLKHVGLVNDPYIVDMAEFQPALSDGNMATLLFSDSDSNNGKEEITMSKVVNDREFPVEVTFTENEEEKKVTVEASAEVEVPEDQVEAVTKQVADAVAPEEEDEGDKLSELEKREKELSDGQAALAAQQRELSDKQTEANFSELLTAGKVVPAQKEAYIALSSQSDTSVELSDGVTKSVPVLLSEFLDKMPKGLKLSEEEGAAGGDGDDVELTDEEKSLVDMGVSEEDLKETKKSEGDK